jgi:hypothetical protein
MLLNSSKVKLNGSVLFINNGAVGGQDELLMHHHGLLIQLSRSGH